MVHISVSNPKKRSHVLVIIILILVDLSTNRTYVSLLFILVKTRFMSTFCLPYKPVLWLQLGFFCFVFFTLVQTEHFSPVQSGTIFDAPWKWTYVNFYSLVIFLRLLIEVKKKLIYPRIFPRMQTKPITTYLFMKMTERGIK